MKNEVNQFPILMYHRVTDEKLNKPYDGYNRAGIVIPVRKLIEQIKNLKKEYLILRLDNIVHCIRQGIKLPHKICAITFDDGFIDHYQNVFQILKRFKISATFFITGDCIAGTNKVRWIDKYYYILNNTPLKRCRVKLHKELSNIYYKFSKKDGNKFTLKSLDLLLRNSSSQQRDEIINDLAETLQVTLNLNNLNKSLYLSNEDIFEMVKYGMDFGAHSMTHSDLGQLDLKEVKREITESGNIIRTITNKKEIAFAYPFGGPETYNEKIIEILYSNDFLYACTSIPEFNTESIPLFELRRMPGETIKGK